MPVAPLLRELPPAVRAVQDDLVERSFNRARGARSRLVGVNLVPELAFAKDSAGFVHLKGTIEAGTFLAAVFVLPAGYRPAQNLFVPVAAERNAYILTTGEVDIVQQDSETKAGFDGISFKAG